VNLPAEVLLFVVVGDEVDPEAPMTLWTLRDAQGSRLTPAFTSMEAASTFLADALRDRRAVPLDYIFRYESARFPAEYPALELALNPTAAEFFQRAGNLPRIV
jgi:hypothetical protein